MPRILRILNRTNIGGPVLNASLLTKFLSPAYETLLISGPPLYGEREAKEILDRFKITPVYINEMGRAFNPINDLISFWKIRKIIKEFKPDIVHTHAAKPGMLGRLAARIENVPCIVHTFHGHVFHSYYSSFISRFIVWVERFLASKSHKIIAISDLQKNELSKVFKIAPENKFKIVNLGLYLEPFETNLNEKRRKFREEFNLNEEDIVITIVGRLVPIKNHKFFIDAIDALIKKSDTSIKAFIVGGGEEWDSIMQNIEQTGLRIFNSKKPEESFDFALTSWRSDIDVINAGSDIIALTSLNEGTPVSLIEAQASGKPVISTNCGGVQDVVKDGETGFICALGNLEEFVQKLEELISNKPLRDKMGLAGQSFVNENFSHYKLVKNISSLYDSLLK